MIKRLLAWLDKRRTASNLFVLLTAIAFYILLSHLSSVVSAVSELYSYISIIVGGAVLAFILNPLVNLFCGHVFSGMKNRKAAHSLSVVCTMLFALAVVALLLWAIIPGITGNISTLILDMDSYLDSFRQFLVTLEERIPFIEIDIDDIMNNWRQAVTYITDWIKDNFAGILNASYKVGAGLFDALVTFVLSIYILLDKEHLVRGAKRLCQALFKPTTFRSVATLCSNSNRILKAYLGGNILDSFIIGISNFLFMVICGMPSPGLISVIVGVTNFIPTFGPFIGAIPSVILILLIKPSATVWFIVFTIILQQIDASLLKPLLFGDAAGIAPIWVLISILVFGRMFGLAGMLFGVPIFAILKMIYDELVEMRITSRGQKDIYHSLRQTDQKNRSGWSGKFERIFHRGESDAQRTGTDKREE